MKKDKTILAIESATALCSVALYYNRELTQIQKNALGTHSSAIFTQIERVLEKNDLEMHDVDAVIVSGGPGSYTGLRVVASAVKGLLFGSDISLYAANTLAGFAAGLHLCEEFREDGIIHAIIDARRKHLYAQSFRVKNGGIMAISPAEIIEIESFYSRLSVGEILIGTGLNRLESAKTEGLILKEIDETGARGLIHLMVHSPEAASDFIKKVDVAEFEPDYLH